MRLLGSLPEGQALASVCTTALLTTNVRAHPRPLTDRPGRLVQRVTPRDWNGCCQLLLRLIHLEHGAEQDVRPVSTVVPASQLPWRVADAANARHEDHAHR